MVSIGGNIAGHNVSVSVDAGGASASVDNNEARIDAPPPPSPPPGAEEARHQGDQAAAGASDLGGAVLESYTRPAGAAGREFLSAAGEMGKSEAWKAFTDEAAKLGAEVDAFVRSTAEQAADDVRQTVGKFRRGIDDLFARARALGGELEAAAGALIRDIESKLNRGIYDLTHPGETFARVAHEEADKIRAHTDKTVDSIRTLGTGARAGFQQADRDLAADIRGHNVPGTHTLARGVEELGKLIDKSGIDDFGATSWSAMQDRLAALGDVDIPQPDFSGFHLPEPPAGFQPPAAPDFLSAMQGWFRNLSGGKEVPVGDDQPGGVVELAPMNNTARSPDASAATGPGQGSGADGRQPTGGSGGDLTDRSPRARGDGGNISGSDGRTSTSGPGANGSGNSVIHLPANVQTSLGTVLRHNPNIDVNALVQWVLRESYMETTADLGAYAERVRFYNDTKKKLRTEAARVNEVLAQMAGADENALADPPLFPDAINMEFAGENQAQADANVQARRNERLAELGYAQGAEAPPPSGPAPEANDGSMEQGAGATASVPLTTSDWEDDETAIAEMQESIENSIFDALDIEGMTPQQRAGLLAKLKNEGLTITVFVADTAGNHVPVEVKIPPGGKGKTLAAYISAAANQAATKAVGQLAEQRQQLFGQYAQCFEDLKKLAVDGPPRPDAVQNVVNRIQALLPPGVNVEDVLRGVAGAAGISLAGGVFSAVAFATAIAVAVAPVPALYGFAVTALGAGGLLPAAAGMLLVPMAMELLSDFIPQLKKVVYTAKVDVPSYTYDPDARVSAAERNWRIDEGGAGSGGPETVEIEDLGRWDPRNTKAQIEAYQKQVEQDLNTVGDDAQLANVDLQNWLQKQQQTLQMMSNISKTLHDTAMALIRNMGG